MNVITCGSWTALPLEGTVHSAQWAISCSRLPDFGEVVTCSADVAGQLVVALQSEYRTDLLEFAP